MKVCTASLKLTILKVWELPSVDAISVPTGDHCAGVQYADGYIYVADLQYLLTIHQQVERPVNLNVFTSRYAAAVHFFFLLLLD